MKLQSLFVILLMSGCAIFSRKDRGQVVTKGNYIVDSVRVDTSLSEGMAMISGFVYDAYSKQKVLYGYVKVINRDSVGTLIDSMGYFALKFKQGKVSFLISCAPNKDLYINNLTVNSKESVFITASLGGVVDY